MIIITLLRYLFSILTALLVMLLVFVLVSVVPIDRTPYTQKDFYPVMKHNLESLDGLAIPPAEHGFAAGFAKENITPAYPTALAGSGLRRLHFKTVHDSIYVRTIVISNGTTSVALVSLDMLLVPPEVTRLLESELKTIGYGLDNTYLSATHTHSSIGNWGKHLSGRLYSGPYDDALVNFLVKKIVRSIATADSVAIPSTISAATIPVSNMLYNRLAGEAGTIDSLLRVVEINRIDSSRLILASFTGHATCDQSGSLGLSRDYPGVFVDALERQGYTMAMFMAGAVGSHGCIGPERGRKLVNQVGETLATAFAGSRQLFQPVNDSTLVMVSVPLELGSPQFRISKNWCVRPWLFNAVFGTYRPELTALRIGDLLILGTPCDFSGELTGALDSAATRLGMRVMVTSFNGNYEGYITKDEWYDVDHYETRLMNWYGPGNGSYLSECLTKLIESLDE
jgi:hypothetical protein